MREPSPDPGGNPEPLEGCGTLEVTVGSVQKGDTVVLASVSVGFGGAGPGTADRSRKSSSIGGSLPSSSQADVEPWEGVWGRVSRQGAHWLQGVPIGVGG